MLPFLPFAEKPKESREETLEGVKEKKHFGRCTLGEYSERKQLCSGI